MIGVMFSQNKSLESYTMQNIKRLIQINIIFPKKDYRKNTRIRRTYSGRKKRETGYVHLKGSPYHDAEGSSQLRLCIHDAIIMLPQ